MLATIWHVFCREWLLIARNLRDVLQPMLFLLLVIALFPLSVITEPKLLPVIAPGVVWLTVLLTMIVSMQRLFRHEYEQGIWEQYLLGPYPLAIILFAKVTAHIVMVLISICLLLPVIALWLYLTWQDVFWLGLTILLGMPTIIYIGAIAVTLTISVRSQAVLLPLLVLPLTIPVLLFAMGIMNNVHEGYVVGAQLALLAAMLSAAMTLAPLAMAASMKVML